MLRKSSDSFHLDNTSDFADAGIDVDKSFSSAISNSSTATSSKAVLAALRALQDKIRRLESERSQSLEECTQLRHQLKNLEIESEHAKQRESLATQRSLQETRSAYDRLLTEKTDLEIRLSKSEDKNKDLVRHTTDLQENIKSLEEEKHKAQLRIREIEAGYSNLESLLQSTQLKEKDLANSIMWENKRHETEVETLSNRIHSLQEDITKQSREKAKNDTKIFELDQLIAQLLAVNESLVAQLSGKPKSKKVPTKVDQKKRTKASSSRKRSSSVPRVANVTTAACDAAKVSKYETRKPTHMITVRNEEVEQLKNLHSMYSNIAKSVLDNSSLSKRTSHSSSGYRHESPRVRTTRISSKKQSAPVSDNEMSSILGSDLKDDSHVNIRYLSTPQESARSSSPFLRSSVSDIEGIAKLRSSSPLLQMKKEKSSDIQDVISSLEDEFDSLNSKYRRLMASVQSDTPSLESQKAEELINVIQSMHKKGEQLRALKSPSS